MWFYTIKLETKDLSELKRRHTKKNKKTRKTENKKENKSSVV